MTRNLAETKRKIIGGAAALALVAGAAVVTAQPAAARPWHHWHHGFWPGAVAAGIVGGAIAAATEPAWGPGYYGYDEYPAYRYGPPPAVAAAPGVGYCEAHYRSYNPETGTYLGYDGVYHHCP